MFLDWLDDAEGAMSESKQEASTPQQRDVIAGLRAGRKLRCDRRDEPLLPWLLAHPEITNRFVQADDQYSYIEFSWRKP